MKKGLKYSVYISGWVCQGEKYIFRIDIPEILDYILERRWTLPNAKRALDKLLDNYPESFYNIFKEDERKRLDLAIDEMAEGL